jgi:hypothetical protein
MDSTELDSRQCQVIGDRLQPTTAYLLKLHQRMRAKSFPADDPLYLKVGLALEAIRAVAIDLHRRQNWTGVDLGPKTK